MQLDHVLIAVSNLTSAADEIQERFGLASVEGGRHAGWGTANRLVPLGDFYLELLAVIDPNEAATSHFGSWVAATDRNIMQPFGWAVRTNDLGEIARRLSLPISAGSRVGRDGDLLHWRLAGVEQAASEPTLPFFIEWGEGTQFPGHFPVIHQCGPVQVTHLNLTGNAEGLEGWLGTHDLPVNVSPGPAGIRSVVLTAAEAVIEIGPTE